MTREERVQTATATGQHRREDQGGYTTQWFQAQTPREHLFQMKISCGFKLLKTRRGVSTVCSPVLQCLLKVSGLLLNLVSLE